MWQWFPTARYVVDGGGTYYGMVYQQRVWPPFVVDGREPLLLLLGESPVSMTQTNRKALHHIIVDGCCVWECGC